VKKSRPKTRDWRIDCPDLHGIEIGATWWGYDRDEVHSSWYAPGLFHVLEGFLKLSLFNAGAVSFPFLHDSKNSTFF
jgi:hypothetical protein